MLSSHLVSDMHVKITTGSSEKKKTELPRLEIIALGERACSLVITKISLAPEVLDSTLMGANVFRFSGIVHSVVTCECACVVSVEVILCDHKKNCIRPKSWQLACDNYWRVLELLPRFSFPGSNCLCYHIVSARALYYCGHRIIITEIYLPTKLYT